MKTIISTLLILLFLGTRSLSSFGQGWEKDYGEFPLEAIALSNGNIAFWNFDSLMVANGSGLIQSASYMRSEGFVINDRANSAEAAVELPDGTITQLRAIRSVVDAGEGGTALPKVFLRNINQDGSLNWVKFQTLPDYAPDIFYEFNNILLDTSGNYYVPAVYRILGDAESRRPLLLKLNPAGELIWVRDYHQEVVDPALGSSLSIKGFYWFEDGTLGYLLQVGIGARLLRLNEDGVLQSISDLQFPEWGPQVAHSTVVGNDVIVDLRAFLSEPLPSGAWEAHTLMRFDPAGELIWERPLSPEQVLAGRRLLTLQNGNVVVLSHRLDAAIHLSWINPDSGVSTRERSFPSLVRRTARTVDELPDGGLIIAGEADIPGGTNIDRGYLLRLDDRGRIFESQIQGTVFEDLDQDCGPLVEAPLQNWIVGFNGTVNRYAITDSLGQFTRRLNAGTYNPVVYPIGPYWAVCPPAPGLGVSAEDTMEVQFPVQALVECPDMHVDISAPFLRRCFNSRYTVRYCNRGTLPAEEAYVEVELDHQLSYFGASIPGEMLGGQVYRFDIGRVDVGECGQFSVDVEVDCDETLLGQTHCTTARVFPDSICIPSEDWSGASMEAAGTCVGDSVQFVLRNVGTAPSSPGLQYLVIEDQVILLQSHYNLEPGEEAIIKVPANGGTYRIEAEQEPNHPGNNQPTATVEFCGPFPNPGSIGFATQYWENDGDASVSIDCQQNIGSYDPNDKRGFPVGFGNDHFIEQGQFLEYHIRFQNTGTDTAFTVVIDDRISEALDLSSIRPGASSHPYTFNITEDRHIQFQFDNILLPDSTTNSAESIGFVKFRVNQVESLPLGTVIQNRAAIYFDFNEAILTNTTLHTIGKDFIPTKDDIGPDQGSEVSIIVMPNPSSGPVQFQFSDRAVGQLVIFDGWGRNFLSVEMDGVAYDFPGDRFSDGIYFFRFEPEVGKSQTGKFIIQK